MKHNNNIFRNATDFMGIDKFNKLANFVYDKKEQKLLKIVSIFHNNAGNRKVEIVTEDNAFKFPALYHIKTISDYTNNLPIYNSETHFRIDLKTELEKEEKLAHRYFKNYMDKVKSIEKIKLLGQFN